MGAAQSKIVPIHIPVGEEPRKAKRKWRKNFKLLSLLCCSTTRPISPVTKKTPCTPPLYEHPYMVAESDIETISLTSIPPPPMTVSNHCLSPPRSHSGHDAELQSNDSGMPNACIHQQLKPRKRIILSPLPDPGRSNPTPNHPKNKKKKSKGKQKALKIEGSETSVKRCKTAVRKDQQLKPRKRIILSPLPDPGQSNPTPNHPKNKKKKSKGKQKALKVEDSETSVKRCKTSVKKNRATMLRENEAAATGPPSVRIPTPWPRRMRTAATKQREAKPRGHTATIRSQNIDDSYAVDPARESPVTITRNVSNSSSLFPEAAMDEIHSRIAGHQHEYPHWYPPQDRPLLPSEDSFDSLDSYTQLRILAGPNVEALSDEEDDDSRPTPGDDGISQSPTISDIISNNIARPKASYGTVSLQRKEGCFSLSPRARSSIKYRRSNNMPEAQAHRNESEKMVIKDVDDSDTVEKEPRRNRLATAIHRLRRAINPTRVSETSDTAEASASTTVQGAETSSDMQVIDISGPTEVAETSGPTEVAETSGQTEVAETSGQTEVAETSGPTEVAETSGPTEVAETSGPTEVAEPRRRARRLVLCPMDQQPHPFSVGFEGWRYELH